MIRNQIRFQPEKNSSTVEKEGLPSILTTIIVKDMSKSVTT